MAGRLQVEAVEVLTQVDAGFQTKDASMRWGKANPSPHDVSRSTPPDLWTQNKRHGGVHSLRKMPAEKGKRYT